MQNVPSNIPDPFAVERVEGLAEQRKFDGLKSIKPMKIVLYLSLSLLIAAMVLSAVDIMGGFGDEQANEVLESQEI